MNQPVKLSDIRFIWEELGLIDNQVREVLLEPNVVFIEYVPLDNNGNKVIARDEDGNLTDEIEVKTVIRVIEEDLCNDGSTETNGTGISRTILAFTGSTIRIDL